MPRSSEECQILWSAKDCKSLLRSTKECQECKEYTLFPVSEGQYLGDHRVGSAREYQGVKGSAKECKGVLRSAIECKSVSWRPRSERLSKGSAKEC